MGITIDQLVALYPTVFHMAEIEAIQSIKEHGLLSTSAILDLLELSSDQRYAIERAPRKESTTLSQDGVGTFVIRDQKPLSAKKLAGCLEDNLTVEDWCLLLNRKVYFFLNRASVIKLLSAEAYSDREHAVIEFDTKRLVEANVSNVTLAPMNTGTTNPFAHARGRNTIAKLSDYPYEDRRERNLVIAREFCVDYRLSNPFDYVEQLWRARMDAEWVAES